MGGKLLFCGVEPCSTVNVPTKVGTYQSWGVVGTYQSGRVVGTYQSGRVVGTYQSWGVVGTYQDGGVVGTCQSEGAPVEQARRYKGGGVTGPDGRAR